MFKEMLKIAKKEVEALTEDKNVRPGQQVTVLLTDKDNIYIATNDFEGLICRELQEKKDKKITKMVTMWKDGCVDLSSFDFRKALVAMDEYNLNTEILLQGAKDYVVKKLSITIY